MQTNVFEYIDSIPKLSENDRIWYNLFIQAYYYQSTQAMDKIQMPRGMRRAIYRNHRAVKNDPFNKNLIDYFSDIENQENQEDQDDDK